MSDDPTPDPSRDEIAELRQGLADLQDAVQALADASTERERRAAQADVNEARQDLDALAKTAGIPRESLERAIADAKTAETREQLRPIVTELLDELRPLAPEPDPEPDPKTKGDDGADPDPDPDAPPPDSEPVVEHWSQRPIGKLIR